jgi:hypothetical protein
VLDRVNARAGSLSHSSRSGRRWRTIALLSIAAGLAVAWAVGAAVPARPVVASADPPSTAARVADFPGPCSLLPGFVPSLLNGTNNSSAELLPALPSFPPPGGNGSAGSTGNGTGNGTGPSPPPPVFQNLSFVNNVTVGQVRTLWQSICTSPAFVAAYAAHGPTAFSFGAAGNAFTRNVSIYPGFAWAAACDRNASLDPGLTNISEPWTGGGNCTFMLIWQGNVSSSGQLTVTGPFASEYPESYGGVGGQPGPISSPRPGAPGGSAPGARAPGTPSGSSSAGTSSSGLIGLAAVLVAVPAGVVAFATRRPPPPGMTNSPAAGMSGPVPAPLAPMPGSGPRPPDPFDDFL